MNNAKILLAGDSAISVEFGQEIQLEINNKVTALAMLLEKESIAGITELVPTYCSLLIHYDPLTIDFDGLTEFVMKCLGKLDDIKMPEKCVVEIPVVYGGEYGPDLAEVARISGLPEDEVIRRHCAPEYPIYMLGFVAGFPYLGGMDKSIAAPRKKSPRLKIASGSVGIAGEQTGIYSVESPGGWQIIGRTPLKLYDSQREKPILLSAGQYIKFCPITESEFKAMME